MEVKKRNVPLFIISIVLLIVSIICICVGLFIQFDIIKVNKDKDIRNEEVINDNVLLEEEIDITDDKVLELMSLVKGKENLEKHSYRPEYLDSFYYKINSDVIVKDIDNDDLLKMMWFYFKDSSVKKEVDGGFVVGVDDFREVYQKIFGSEIPFSKNTTSTTADTCLKINYNTVNDNYEFYNTCTSTSNIIIYPKIVKAIKSDEEIRVYEQVAFYSNHILYSDIDLRNTVTKEFLEEEFDNYLGSLFTYVYTFKLDENNNYYFYKVSIE